MTTGKYAGIGSAIRFHKKQNCSVISEPFENSPSQRVGLKAGDQILRIDGKDVKGWTTNKVTGLLRGEAGTTFELVVRRGKTGNPIDDIRPVMTAQELLALRQQADSVMVDDRLYNYVTELVNATRNHDMLSLGISPRGSLAIIAMAKANALINGRGYVIPEDISEVFAVTTAHRIMLTPVARMNRVSEQDIAEQVLRSVVPPRIFA